MLTTRVRKPKDKGSSNLVFSLSSNNDLWAEIQIGTSLYGEDDIVPFSTLIEWKEANNEMFMSTKDHGRVVGYSSLMPMAEDVIIPLLHDKIREREIPVQAIKEWTEPQLSIYVATVTVKPSGKKKIDRARGSFLIKRTVKWALTMNRQYNIKNWYGIGATKEGQHLFESLGFGEIVSLSNGERKGYRIQDIKQPVRLINQILAEIERGTVKK